MKINSQEIKDILKAIDILLEIKCLIRNCVPSYEWSEKELTLFHPLFNSLNSLLQPLFTKYSQINIHNIDRKLKKEIILELNNLIKNEEDILISANHSKKILKNLGFNPLKLTVSGGPLTYSDYLKINPNLRDKDLEGIKKKTTKVINRLISIAREGSKITFIYEKKNVTDQIILEELREIKSIIGKDIFLLEIPSWKILDE